MKKSEAVLSGMFQTENLCPSRSPRAGGPIVRVSALPKAPEERLLFLGWGLPSTELVILICLADTNLVILVQTSNEILQQF